MAATATVATTRREVILRRVVIMLSISLVM